MHIAYVGPFSYPSSNANSIRINGVCRILENLGHEITIIPGLNKNKEDIESLYNIISLNEYENGFFSGLNGCRGLFLGDNTISILEKMNPKPDIIILYGSSFGYLKRLLDFRKKNNIKLILDIVEWYDPRHLPGGLLGPYSIINELSMRFFVKKADGLIVISDYLRKYYQDSHKNIFLLPPVFAKGDTINFYKHNSSRVNLCYSGTPGKKENFSILCEALEMAYKNKIKFTMNFVGITRDFFNKNQNYTFISDNDYCKFYGRVDNTKAKEIVSACHFLIFFRPYMRFSNAGFPSKVAESFSLGTSVITNNFSDLDKYIVNDFNGYIFKEGFSSSDVFKVIKKVSDNIRNYDNIQINSLSTFERYFSIKSYLNLDIFIKSLFKFKPIK